MTGGRSGIDVVNFGCRLNAAEAEAMRAHALNAGLKDAVIVNTCAVTNEATRQARQAIRKLARERPGADIIVTGCAAQIEPDAFAAIAGVTRILGNGEKLKAETWKTLLEPDAARVRVGDIMSVRETALHLSAGFEARARAFLEVQNGCDHRCTFCIIPFGRGPSRSVPAGAVVAEARRLSEEGFDEIVLTGVDLTSYGADLPGGGGLGRLVKQILKGAPSLKRLRLSSLDPVEVDETLIDAFASEARLMPHLHLSLQAGDDMILKRMKRRHTRAQAVALTEQIRKLRPETVFGADLIAGFPTETDEMAAGSLSIVDDCALSLLHVFPFSPKKGTPAARMPLVPRETVKARAAALREAGAKALARTLSAVRGEADILIERPGFGRTEGYLPAEVSGTDERGIVRARITGSAGDRLLAAVQREAVHA